MKYITKRGDKYILDRKTKKLRVTMSLNSEQEAKDIRDIFTKHNWKPNLKQPKIYMRNNTYYILYQPEHRIQLLHKTNNKHEAEEYIKQFKDTLHIKKSHNGYIIQKSIKNKMTTYGSYPTFEEAEKFRNLLRKHEWDYNYFQEIYKQSTTIRNKYICKNRGKYSVMKKTKSGVTRTYGSYKTIEEARKHRDQLIKNGWKSSSKHYITRIGGRYWIYRQKTCDGEYYRMFYAYSKTPEELYGLRDKYVEEGFPVKPLFETSALHNISFSKGYGEVERGNMHYYGNKDLTLLIAARDILEQNNWCFIEGEYVIRDRKYDVTVDNDGKWSVELIDDVPSLKYINKVSDNCFELVYDGELFGVFNNLRACQYARGVMLNFDWNKDIIKYI